MATQIAEAYVQIKPTTKNIKSELTKQMSGDLSAAGEAGGSVLGEGLVSKLKGVIAAAGIGVAIKEALSAGGDLQQSFGGLDTLYEEASESAKNYAKEAVNAGISMNDYAEQAVSFGAALKQSLGGDVTKAAEAANTAILDMADNSAKMGTSLDAIQNAYQGFAKGNYTMLDNLKLGYGGTKTEMERLLADAKELSEVEYDIDNLSDVYSAIHVIQENLGLTGVAADEASTTFTGSMQAMQAAVTNLLADLTTGKDISGDLQVLANSFMTFFNNNLIPMLGNLIMGLPGLLGGIITSVIQEINTIASQSPEIVNMGINLITELVTSLISNIPYLIEAGYNLITSLVGALMEVNWIEVAMNLISSLRENLDIAAGEILGTDGDIIGSTLTAITNGLPDVLKKGTEIVNSLVNGLIENLPTLIDSVGTMLTEAVGFIMDNLPAFLEAGADILFNLIDGIIENLPEIISSILTVLINLQTTVYQHLPEFLEKGLEIMLKIGEGLLKATPKVIAQIPSIIKSMIKVFTDINWADIGKNIINGIKDGVLKVGDDLVKSVKNVASNAVNGVKNFLGIHSPSRLFRDQIGKYIPEGMAVGIEANTDSVTDAMNDLSKATVNGIDTGSFDTNISAGQLEDNNSSILLMSMEMERLINMLENKLENMTVHASIDGDDVFNSVRSRAQDYREQTRRYAFE